MEHHPIIQVLDALYNIWQYDWRYADIMSLLRSEYVLWHKDEETPLKDQLQAFRQQLDETETVILVNVTKAINGRMENLGSMWKTLLMKILQLR